MEYIDNIKKCESLDVLFSLWKSKDSKDGLDHKDCAFISDGIVDPATWNSGTKKIVLLN